jgi:hypothetical protein
MSGCPACPARCPRPPSASTRPVRVRHPPVRCPVSGVRPSGVRCQRPASASVSRLSAPVSSWSAWTATRLGTGRVGMSLHLVRDRLVGCPSPSLALGAGAGRAGSGGVGRWSPASSPETRGRWPGSTVWPTGRSRCAPGSPLAGSGCVGGSPTYGRLHAAQQGHAADVRPTTTWVVSRPRGAAFGPTARRAARPHRGPRRQAGPAKAARPGGETQSDLGE